jgi:exopolysaccharide biosynthesis WecB/TagA/CpsF family protein
VVADGAPLVVLSRIFGPKLPERVAGSDLIFDIVEAASRKGLRVYFFGGEEESTRQAIAELQRRYPGLQVAGCSCPRVALEPDENQESEEEEMCRQITEARTDILLVGLGCPKQELFVHRNASRLAGMVAIGLGGSFNFVSGRVRRAPLWVQKIGMEWIYRIIQEPRRLFMRYFTDAFYLAADIITEPFRREERKKT